MIKSIPYATQWIDESDIKAVIASLKSGWLTQGPKVAEFEKAIAYYTGAKYAVAISNGTAALHAACFAAGITKGDEVITSPITFAASANCVLYCGGKPVFADIRSDTLNIDPKEIEKKITSKTKAIIPVDFTGQPADLDSIRRIAKKHKPIVIEDAAHSLGAEYKGKKIGALSDLTTLSFHAVKHITTGEGGMVLTNDKSYYKKLVMFRTHGITRDKDILTKNEGGWYYEMHHLGYNYRLTDLQCALGISQLKRLSKFLKIRRDIVKRYNEAFNDIPGIIMPYENLNCKSAWHLYIIRVKSRRGEIFEALRRKNIGVNMHYIPVYYHPYYRKLGYKKGICPQAEKYYSQAITLPLFPKMKDAEVNYVIRTVKEIVKTHA